MEELDWDCGWREEFGTGGSCLRIEKELEYIRGKEKGCKTELRRDEVVINRCRFSFADLKIMG